MLNVTSFNIHNIRENYINIHDLQFGMKSVYTPHGATVHETILGATINDPIDWYRPPDSCIRTSLINKLLYDLYPVGI